MRLHGEDDAVLRAEIADAVGCGKLHRELVARFDEPQAVGADRGQMGAARNDRDFLAGARELGGDEPADRPGADHANPHPTSPAKRPHCSRGR